MRYRGILWNSVFSSLSLSKKSGSRKSLSSRISRKLRLEQLEDRRVLTPYYVTELGDSGNSTLRQAIIDANTYAGADEIVIQAGGTIKLTSGELPQITEALTITGQGVENTIIDAQLNSRIFNVASTTSLLLSDMTLTNGNVVGSANGGAIYNAGSLTLDHVTLVDNHSENRGGGVYSDDFGSFIISNSTFEANTAKYGGGARIQTKGTGTFSILNSTFSNNVADDDLSSTGGTGSGGGLYVWGDATSQSVTITNSTFSNNEAAQYSGGIRAQNNAGLLITNSTITENTAYNTVGGLSSISGSSVLVENSILAGNTSTNNAAINDAAGSFHVWSQNNLLGNTTSTALNNAQGTIVINSADPLLTTLGDYGGATRVHVPEPNSQAIDGGNNLYIGETWDQRGEFNRRINGSSVDIGAVEANVVQTAGGAATIYGTDRNDDIKNLFALGVLFDDTFAISFPYTLTSFEAWGFDGDDVIASINSTIPVIYHGGDGNDTLSGSPSADLFWGGDGDDIIRGEQGDDQLYGEDGQDELYGEDGNDVLDGGTGVDTLHPGAGQQYLGTDDFASLEFAQNTHQISTTTVLDILDWSLIPTAVTTSDIIWAPGVVDTVNRNDATASRTDLPYGFYDVQSRYLLGEDTVLSEPVTVKAYTNALTQPFITSVEYTTVISNTESVSWSHFSIAPGSFILERSLNGLDGNWETISSTIGSTVSTYQINSAHQSYYYRLTMASGAGGTGTLSDPSEPARNLEIGSNREIILSASAEQSGSIANVSLSWPDEYLLQQNPETFYTISRRLHDEGGVYEVIDTFTAAEQGTTWTDIVDAGQEYEYKVERDGILSGDSTIVVATRTGESQHEERGSVILLVDDRFGESLVGEIARLENDLIGDGWNVIRQDVDIDAADLGISISNESLTVPAERLRQFIIDRYNDPQFQSPATKVQSVLLLGHLPVVRSGWLSVDGHPAAAYPADAYYGDIDGDWTDLIDFGSAADNHLPNIDGDGMYDQVLVPTDGDSSPQELSVGRIDMFSMALADEQSTYTTTGQPQIYSIEIGKHLVDVLPDNTLPTEEQIFDYLTLVVGDNFWEGSDPLEAVLGEGVFTDLKLKNLLHATTGAEIPEITIDFTDLIFADARQELGQLRHTGGVVPYGSFDPPTSSNTLTAEDNKNNWQVASIDPISSLAQQIGSKFRITRDTVLEVTFSSSDLPDVVAIGLGNDEGDDGSRQYIKEENTFRLHANPTTPWGRAIDSNQETELLRQYLNKDHAFRQGQVLVQNRALVDDVLGKEASLENAYSMFGAGGVDVQWDTEFNWKDGLDSLNESALWGFGGASGRVWSSGALTSNGGVLSSDFLNTSQSNAVFTKMEMSWGYDWNRTDNLMTSILADEGLGLTSFYSRGGVNDFREMGIGHTIGQGYLTSQNSGNAGAYRSIVGDPTLRMHIVAPPKNVHAFDSGNDVLVTWDASAFDTINGGAGLPADYPGEFLGYHVYQASSLSGTFTRVDVNGVGDLFTGTSILIPDTDPTDVYMVRAVKREDVNSGSYMNLSQGAFSTTAPQVVNVTISGSNSVHSFSFNNSNDEANDFDGSGIQLQTVPVGNADTVEITFSEPITNLDASSLTLHGLNYTAGTVYTLSSSQGFDYDNDTDTAKWKFSAPLAADQYLITLSDTVTDAGGNQLDGEWVNPFSVTTTNSLVSVFPSGDGISGGNFDFVFTILPGDASLDGVVDSIDEDILITSLSGPGGSQFTQGDFDGSGSVGLGDINYYSDNENKNLRDLVFADFNYDYRVDSLDYAIYNANVGTGTTHEQGDANHDQIVDGRDFLLLQRHNGLEIAWVM